MNREPRIELTWTDPVTGRYGYVAVDSLVRGVAAGGLRVRDGCTLEEIRGLARTMGLKEALAFDPADRYRPVGGAKGGIDAHPNDPDIPGIIRRFLTDMLPLLRERWATGEDLGVRQDDLDDIAADLGLSSTAEAAFRHVEDPTAAHARLKQAAAVADDGLPLADLVGGYGVAAAALAYAERSGLAVKEASAAIQGFGSIGGATARYLSRAGVRVVVVADRHGLVRNDDGLDVERLLTTRDRFGDVDRSALAPGDSVSDGKEWLAGPVDILVPAATSYVIGAGDASGIDARFVVEGANMPTLPEAERALADRGIPVLPDFLANLATNAWWWWMLHGDVEPTVVAAQTKITRLMRRLVDRVAADAESSGTTLREAALNVAEENRRAA